MEGRPIRGIAALGAAASWWVTSHLASAPSWIDLAEGGGGACASLDLSYSGGTVASVALVSAPQSLPMTPGTGRIVPLVLLALWKASSRLQRDAVVVGVGPHPLP